MYTIIYNFIAKMHRGATKFSVRQTLNKLAATTPNPPVQTTRSTTQCYFSRAPVIESTYTSQV